MKKSKKIIIMISLVVILVGYVGRVLYINSRFPKEKYTLAQAGEGLEYDGIEYTGISGEIMSAKEFMDKYDYTDIYDDGKTFVVIMWVQVENKSDVVKRAKISEFVISKGLWCNGVDMFALWYINGDDFDTDIAAGDKKVIGASAIISSANKKLIENDEPWTARITGWPDRREFVFPVK